MMNPFHALKSAAKTVGEAPGRYVYVDGSPYGTSGISRFFQNPPVKLAAVVGVSTYAVRSLFAKNGNELLFDFVFDMGVTAVGMAFTKNDDRLELGPLANQIAIDKDGKKSTSLSLTKRIKDHMLETGLNNSRWALYGGIQLLADRHYPVTCACIFGSTALWRLAAWKNLKNKKWKVVDRPKVPQEQEVTIKFRAATILTPS